MSKIKKIHVFISTGVIIAAILGWAFIESAKPLPGELIADLGRGHVAEGSKIDYNSNPPTSGPHYEVWTKPGVYSEPQDDRNLVHSLEHGYIIISYNCDKKISSFRLIPQAKAHGIEDKVNEATSSATEATSSAVLSLNFRSKECHDLVDKLISIYEKKGKRKIIITPRPNLDTQIALTAWGRMDKFDQFDENRVGVFIDKLRDKGPEQTME
ncbi:DUF3105 domain-containing protein [Candidatus Daviesbacteria bacterium]|nr:DUF3105 domain-containing protein [Candidatus Daviesbacteria bacterium]